MSGSSSNAKYGKKRRNGISDFSGDWQGFVDLPLSEEDKAHVLEYVASAEFEPEEAIQLLVESGYKLSIGPQNRGNSKVASITGRGPECVNLGFSLSAFGPDAISALGAVCYKHFVLCGQGRWSEFSDSEERQLSLWG